MTATKNKHKTGEPLPYYKWYWRDWRGSRAVQKMTAAERGIYRELLDEQWRLGHIVNDPAWLAEAAMCTEQELANAWQVLSKCFPPIENTDGQLLANTRLEAERTETDTVRIKRAISGRIGGKANAKQMLYSSSRAEQSSSRLTEADASSASGLEGPAPSADELVGPEVIRTILDNLKGFGGGRA